MRKKLRKDYYYTHQRAHHHTIVVTLGLVLCSVAFARQFSNSLMGDTQTHAAYDAARCETNSGSIDIPLIECEALAALYSGTNGDSWTNSSGWFDSTTISGNWYGISCGGGFVSQINLSNNNLSGSLPPLSGLSNLQNLYLDLNQLTSLTSGAFNDLSNLQYLSLNDNQISSLVSGAFNGLSNLAQLDFYNNWLISIASDAFIGLSNLQNLNLDNNQISSLASGAFVRLSSLSYLSLSSNQLTEIDFSNLSGLNYLYLNNNLFTTLPKSITGLSLDWAMMITAFDNNCRDTGFMGTNLVSYLDTNIGNDSWQTVTNPSCPAPQQLTRCETNQDNLDIPLAECEALTRLYSGTNGDNWTNSSGWFDSTTVCSVWYGVSCNGGFVSYINLGSNNLSGSVYSLSGLSHVTDLYLWYNNLTSIETGAFAGLSSLNRLGLNNNQLTSIATGTFSGLADGLRLVLNNNQLTFIPDGAFAGLSGSILYLDHNQLTSISSGMFAGTTNLQGINLSNNYLTSIPDDTFTELSTLNGLLFSYNQITSISSGTFSGLSNLNTLFLSSNRLTSIETGTFHGLTSLQTLFLDSNQITSISSETFSGLINLQSLRLYSNQLSSLPNDIFSGLSSLATLSLKSNQITSLQSDTFAGLVNLNQLEINSNLLTSIGDGTFAGLSDLATLSLQSNQITSLQGDTFSGLSSLTTLRLDSNLLTIAPESTTGLISLNTGGLYLNTNCRDTGAMSTDLVTFMDTKAGTGGWQTSINPACPVPTRCETNQGSLDIPLAECEALTNLYSGTNGDNWTNSSGWFDSTTISGNWFGISCSGGSVYQINLFNNNLSGSLFPLSGLSNVQTLSLYSNQLSSIEQDAFNGLSNLQILYLSYNQLSSIQSGNFTGLPSLQNLELYSNQLTSIESDSFAGLSSVTTLRLDDNQLVSLQSGDFIGLSGLTTLYLNSNQLTSIEEGAFNGLSSLNGLNISSNLLPSVERGDFTGLSTLGNLNLTLNQLTLIESGAFAELPNLGRLDVNFNLLSSIDNNTFSGLVNLNQLEINANLLTSIGDGTFSGLSLLQTLRIGSNQLVSVQSGNFTGLPSLQSLALYGNQLTSIANDTFIEVPTLGILGVYSNQLTSIESGAFNGLSNLTMLYLNGNQLSSIEDGTFSGLSLLQHLNLDSNLLTLAPESTTGLISLNTGWLYLTSNCRDTGTMSSDLIAFMNIKAGGSTWQTSINPACPVPPVLGCTFAWAENYNPLATIDDSSCALGGCTDPGANNYNIDPNITYDNGACTYDIPGCMSVWADNYNPLATIDDASCTLSGCTDPSANNYDINVTYDNGSCTYDIRGCTFAWAENYNPAATVDDASCTLSGCTDPGANNYDINVTYDNGSCTYTPIWDNDPQTWCTTFSGLIDIPLAECEALTNLYSGTNGDSWTNSSGWFDSTTISGNWFGVSCSGGSVNQIDLNNNNLSGSLPPLSGLSSLRFLDLNSNQLSSIGSGAFAGLSSLQFLYLHSNQLTSTTSGIFAGLSNLQFLYLHSNQLTSITSDIFSGLSSLHNLSLNNNQLTSITSDIFSGLSSLQYLWLNHNQLSSLVSGAFNGLSNLNSLYLNSNLLATLPESTTGLNLTTGSLYLNTNCRDTGAMNTDLVTFMDSKASSSGWQTSLNPACPVTLSAPVFLTQSQTVTGSSISYLYGLATGATQVYIYNGSGIFVISAGAPIGSEFYTTSVSLNLGSNIFTARAVDASGNLSPASDSITIIRSSPPPVFSCDNVTDVPVGECNALVALYSGTNGDSWTNSSGWNGSGDSTLETVCDWYGIICDAGFVTDIALQNNNLQGTVTLSDLTHLQNVILEVNGITDIEVCGVTTLQNLSLGSTQLTSLDLCALPNLQSLFLQIVPLTNVNLSGLSNLQVLYLTYNQLINLDVSTLTSLQVLNVYGNQLSSLDVTNATNLSQLEIGANNFTDLPDITSLPLVYLGVSNNELTSLDVSNHLTLQELYAQNNNISSLIVDTYTSYTFITGSNFVDFTNNCLASVTGNVLNFLNIYDSDWRIDQDNCIVPEAFSCDNVTDVPVLECNALVALYSGTNGNNWTNSSGWNGSGDATLETVCDWYGLTCDSGTIIQLILSTNNLSGDLPTELGNLTGLTYIDISSNQLTSIPSSIGNLDELEQVYFDNNQFTSLPDEIGGLASVWNLSITSNQIVSLPDGIYDLITLEYLYISANELSSLSSDIGNFVNLLELEAGSNQFTSLPSTIGSLTNLEQLYLNNNQLTTLPSTINTINLSLLSAINIQENCIDPDSLSGDTTNILDTLDPGWENLQDNCDIGTGDSEGSGLALSGFSIEKIISTTGIYLYESFTYTINYVSNNSGDQSNIIVKDFLPTGLTIQSATPMYDAYMTTDNTYGTGGDICYTQFLDETGIYYTVLNDWLLSNMGMELFDVAVYYGYTGSANGASEWFSDTACPGLIGSSDFSLCMLGLGNGGIDISVLDPSCGVTGPVLDEPYYQWNLGMLGSGQSGTIILEVQAETGFAQDYSIINSAEIKNPYYSSETSVTGYFQSSEEGTGQATGDNTIYDDSDLNIEGSGYVYGYDATGSKIFTGGYTIIIEAPLLSGDYLKFTTSGFTIEVVSGIWDGILYPPTAINTGSTGLAEFGEVGIPDPWVNNGITTTTRNILLTMQAGATDASLLANSGDNEWYFIINFIVPDGTLGEILPIYRSEDGDTWTGNFPDQTCELTTGLVCSFRTDHLSFFAPIRDVITINPIVSDSVFLGNPFGGTPGWKTDVQAGICETRDCSPSFYDRQCGVCEEIKHKAAGTGKTLLIDSTTGFTLEVTKVNVTMQGKFSNELIQAYVFARDIGITTIDNIDEAMVYEPLIRQHAAKMMVNYAVNILGMQPDVTRVCTFEDMKNQSNEMQLYATLACQLGIMGVENDIAKTPASNFNGNVNVARSQFGTMLSRSIYVNDPTGTNSCWYCAHLNRLKIDDVMTKIDTPATIETRGYVWLMMMRAYQKVISK